MTIPFHPLADIFPLMEGKDFADLVADIKAHGQREPITYYNGTVLDGRNRYRACIEAGIKPHGGEFDGEEKDLVAFVISANLQRRHMDDKARATVAAKLSTYKRGDNQHTAIAGTSQAKAARLLNVSPAKVERVAKILKTGAPELVTAFEQGGVSISAGAAVASLPVEEQREIVAAGPEAVKEAAKEIRETPREYVSEAKVENEYFGASINPDDYDAEKAWRAKWPNAAKELDHLADHLDSMTLEENFEFLKEVASGYTRLSQSESILAIIKPALDAMTDAGVSKFCATVAGYAISRQPKTEIKGKPSDERRAKISAKMKGRKKSPEHKEKVAAAVRARHADPAYKAKISERAATRKSQREKGAALGLLASTIKVAA